MPNKPLPWVFDDRAGRYRNAETGRFMSRAAAVAMRDLYIERTKSLSDELATRLSTGQITINQWELEMRKLIKTTYVNEYRLAKGGTEAMTQADWGRIGGLLRNQYGYLSGFAQDIRAGKTSGGAVKIRARMYIDSATQAHERAKAAGAGFTLPAYPGDGSTRCRANCKCHWEIVERLDRYDCYWRLEAQAEHCIDCDARSREWNPYVVRKVGL